MCEYGFMRTTIELPENLFRQAKVRAAMRGVTLKELFTRFVEQGLQSDLDPPLETLGRTEPLPEIIPPKGRKMPALTNAEIQAIFDAEDAAGLDEHRG
jgi:hypothetical protein